jgi:hypothetical protein
MAHIDFIKLAAKPDGDEPKGGILRDVLTKVLAPQLTVDVLSKGYSGLSSPLSLMGDSSEAFELQQALRKSLNPKLQNIPISYVEKFPNKGMYVAKSAPDRLKDAVRIPIDSDGVVIDPALKPGLLAHEYGHSQSPFDDPGLRGKVFRKSRRFGSMGHRLATLAAPLIDDDETSRNVAAAGSLAYSPIMLEEIKASRRGHKLMNNLHQQLLAEGKPGLSMRRRLGSYAGLPSYALAAGTPWITRAVSRYLNKTGE